MRESLTAALAGLSVACALAAGATRALAADAKPGAAPVAQSAAEASDAWLFLGRRSDNAWRPASASIQRPQYPVKPGARVIVRRDALVYASVDCTVTEAGAFQPGAASEPVVRVKAERAALEVLGAPLECPSVGGARTVWAQVRIPAERLIAVER